MRVKVKFIHKKSFIAAFTGASTLLFATSAYALSTSNISVHAGQSTTNTKTASNSASPENSENPETVSLNEDDNLIIQQSSILNNDSTKNSAKDSEHTSTQSTENSAAISYSSSHISVSASGEADVKVADNGIGSDVVTIAGSESNNDSRVRIRVRNSSNSELNGDEQDGGGNFSLQIQESATAD